MEEFFKKPAGLFDLGPDYTGYAFFVAHNWKGGYLRLKYENGEIIEKASLTNSGEWANYGIHGVHETDFRYEDAQRIDKRDISKSIASNEYLLVEKSNIDLYAPAKRNK